MYVPESCTHHEQTELKDPFKACAGEKKVCFYFGTRIDSDFAIAMDGGPEGLLQTFKEVLSWRAFDQECLEKIIVEKQKKMIDLDKVLRVYSGIGESAYRQAVKKPIFGKKRPKGETFEDTLKKIDEFFVKPEYLQ